MGTQYVLLFVLGLASGAEVSKDMWLGGYCYCPVAGVSTCTPMCKDEITCNNNGKCVGGVCACNATFTGEWCQSCKEGYTGAKCDTCAAGFYGPNCDRRCTDSAPFPNGCGGMGTCTAEGKCQCQAAFAGEYCTRCNEPQYGWESGYPNCTGECNAATTCSGNGVCVRKTGGGSECYCKPGVTGTDCSACTDSTKTFPNCGSGAGAPVPRSPPTTTNKGSADAEDCPGSNLALPILLSIFLTALVILGGFGLFKLWQKKKAGGGADGKKGGWTEFEGNTSNAYSQL